MERLTSKSFGIWGLFLVFLPYLATSSLPITKPCGDFICQEHEYCSPVDHTCQKCGSVCNTTSHNFDQSRCETDCQDYLHDERYLRVEKESGDLLLTSELSELYKSLQRDVLVLKILVAISLIVIAITIASFIAFLIYFFKHIQPSSKGRVEKCPPEKKPKSLELPIIYNNKYGVESNGEMSPPPSLRESKEESRNDQSPVKSERSNNSVATTPGTMSTNMSTSVKNSMNSVLSQRYRREPSESTLPDSPFDNASLSHPYQSHHV